MLKIPARLVILLTVRILLSFTAPALVSSLSEFVKSSNYATTKS